MIKNVLNHILDKDGKIIIPEWAKRVKLDVGTSMAAPQSEIWLEKDKDLVVFAFEPNFINIKILSEGQNKWPIHIKKERINHSFFVINCALADFSSEKQKFYCTDYNLGDSGTSSFFKLRNFNIPVQETEVSVITLKNFFDLFPWDKIPFIEYLKIDAQGSDLNIIKGAGDYLDRIVYITAEPCPWSCYSDAPSYGGEEIKTHLLNYGFEQINHPNTDDPTFINSKYKHLAESIFIHQKG